MRRGSPNVRQPRMMLEKESMSKAVLQRLERLVADREWVKGAVNYDEDLHFSTYYVRASCSNVTGSLYPGYSCIVGSYDGLRKRIIS